MDTLLKIRHNEHQATNASKGWMYFLGTSQTDIDLLMAEQARDNGPLIKSAEPVIVKPEISILVEQALELNPYVDSSRIRVLNQGNRIILSGKVKSWFQKEEAGRVAKLASGNLNIINDIAISYYS